jgi:transposase InsO family protein
LQSAEKLISPQGKRRAVAFVREERDYSQRRACEVMIIARSTLRYTCRVGDEERRLIAHMKELSLLHPCFGYQRIHALLCRDGWRVNRKRVQRLWRTEGFNVRQNPRQQRTPSHSRNSCVLRRAKHRNHA